MLALVAVCCVFAPQDATFPNGDPSGGVVDTAGRGIAGASVAVVRLPSGHGIQYDREIDAILKETPLPTAVTTKDGTFVLPLTRDHRRLGAMPGDGSFAVRARKPGYQTCWERLDQGPSGYLGSRLVLHPLGPEDRIELQVEDPVPGMLLAVYTAADDGETPGEVVPVPANGRVVIPFKIVADPSYPSDTAPAPGLWVMAQVLHPQRGTDPIAVDPRKRPVTVPHDDSRNVLSSAVARSDGGAIAGLRGLYRARDGSEHWFALADDRVQDHRALRLVALVADGCEELRDVAPEFRCDTDGIPMQLLQRTLRLIPSGAPARPARLATLDVTVVDDAGARIAGATLRWEDLAQARTGLGRATPVTHDDGTLSLADLEPRASWLMICADGCLPRRELVDLEVGVNRQTISLERAGTLRVRTLDRGGAPVPHVAVRRHTGRPAPASGQHAQAWSLWTDSLGRARFLVGRGDEDKCRVGSGQGLRDLPAADASRVDEVEVTGQKRHVVLVSGCESSRWFEFRDGKQASVVESKRPFFRTPPAALHVREFENVDGTVWLGVDDAPPIRITAKDLQSGDLDRSAIVRRVPLRVPAGVRDLRIVATLYAKQGDFPPELGNCAWRDKDGQWYFVARDRGEWHALAIATGYREALVHVPAAGGKGEEAVAVEMVPR